MRKALITAGLIMICVITILVSGASCSSCDRLGKSIDSNVNGGLNRTVTVYDYTGNVIAKYKGRIDVQVNESKVLFDMDGKRYIYYNAVVEVIEK